MKNIVSIFSCADAESVFPVSFVAYTIAANRPDKKILMIYSGYEPGEKSQVKISFGKYKDIEVETSDRANNLYTVYISKESGRIYSNADEAKNFVKEIAKHFDLVICDAGNDLKIPYALGTLFASDYIFYLIDGQIESLNRFIGMSPVIKKLKIAPSGYIIDLDFFYPEYSMIHLFDKLGDESEDMTYVLCLSMGDNGLIDLAEDLIFVVFESAEYLKDLNKEQVWVK